MSQSLDDAVTSLQAVQTDDADVQTQVAAALTAVQAAQAGETSVEDPVWTQVKVDLVAGGWTAPVVPEIPPVA